MKKYIITIFFLVAALGLYATGLALPALTLVVFGLLAEGIFWVRVLGCSRSETGT